jgi:hypothetical protein
VPVEFSDEGIRSVEGDGDAKEVSWTDLTEIRIVTNGNGPFVEDVFFVFIASEKRCLIVPQPAVDDAALHRLQRLPGFDNHALIEAMYSTTDTEFVVWRAGAGS